MTTKPISTAEWAYFYALRANVYNFGAFSNTLGLIFTSSYLSHTTTGLKQRGKRMVY